MTEKLKRYNMVINFDNVKWESDDGEWVRYSDVASLVPKLETMKEIWRTYQNRTDYFGFLGCHPELAAKADAITEEPQVITACGSDGMARDHTIPAQKGEAK